MSTDRLSIVIFKPNPQCHKLSSQWQTSRWTDEQMNRCDLALFASQWWRWQKFRLSTKFLEEQRFYRQTFQILHHFYVSKWMVRGAVAWTKLHQNFLLKEREREGGGEVGREGGGERKGGRERDIWWWLFLTWSWQPANVTDDSMIVHCTLIPSALLPVLGRSPHKQRREKSQADKKHTKLFRALKINGHWNRWGSKIQ